MPRLLYALIIIMFIVMIGFVAFPNLQNVFDSLSTAGMLPITASAQTFLPYVFLLLLAYLVYHTYKGK